jgi:hypothetical protein
MNGKHGFWMKEMTESQVHKKFRGIDELCRILSVRHGVIIGAERCENPNNPRQNKFIVSFEIPPDKYKGFFEAREVIIEVLGRMGMTLEHEAGGDGETGPILTYSVMKLIKW